MAADGVEFPSHHGDHNVPGWKVPKNYLRGYTGNALSKPLDEDALNAFYRRRMIRGYSGFIPDARTVSGRPIIPSDDVQKRTIEVASGGGTVHFERVEEEEEKKDLQESFKEYAKHMDLLERYADATNQLLARGQTPEMLLKLVQAKISERVRSFSEQFITVKLRFEAAGECLEKGFNESAFRGACVFSWWTMFLVTCSPRPPPLRVPMWCAECLEKMNIQLDDVQSLALFSFFDTESTGLIRWEDFAAYAMVANPRGGTAVRPKSITATRESGSWDT